MEIKNGFSLVVIDKIRVDKLSTQQKIQWVKIIVFAVIDDVGEWIDLGPDDYLVGIIQRARAWVVLEGAHPVILKHRHEYAKPDLSANADS